MENGELDHCPVINRPFLIGKNNCTKKAYVFRPGCGRWDCEYCRNQNKADWTFVAMSGAVELQRKGKHLAFVTITARGGKGRSQAKSIADFAVGWPKLARRAKYHNQGYFEYFLIPELHKNGVVHYHLVATDNQTKRWWKDNAYQSGLGYMSDRKPVSDVAGVVFYVVKYITKTFELGGGWPEGLRRVRTSRGWPRHTIDTPPDWEYDVYQDKGALMWEVHLLEDYGFTVSMSREVRES
jgi:hypothetical protein